MIDPRSLGVPSVARRKSESSMSIEARESTVDLFVLDED